MNQVTNDQERADLITMAQILLETPARIEEAVDYITRAVEIEPILSENERQILSIAYKAIISPRRHGIKVLMSKINPISGEEDENLSPALSAKLDELKQTLIDELLMYSNKLINLIDNVIVPEKRDPENGVFYIKLKADYYRYICEAYRENTPERNKYTELATQAYQEAISASKSQLLEYSPTNLGLVLNYTVFLYDIAGKTKEAVELAKEVYAKCTPLIDQNNQLGQQEATSILKVLDENIQLWDNISRQ